MTPEPLVVEDDFAGAGGWEVALAALHLDGFTIGYEWDEAACATARTAGLARVHGDVTLKGSPDGRFFLYLASPPCQGFSAAGKGKGRHAAATAAILLAVKELGAGATYDDVAAEITAATAVDDPDDPDDRVALVVWPLYWALTHRPDNIAWEQVPAVLPLWEACGEQLRAHGYDVATGLLTSEQYDVPQTRKRAILIASRTHPVQMPAPVRRRFRKGEAQHDGDPALLPWLSMADALGWAPGTLVGFPRRPETARGDGRTVDSSTVTLDGVDYRARDLFDASRPAPVVTGKSRSWSRWQLQASGFRRPNDRTQPRELDEPAHTVMFGHSKMVWLASGGVAGEGRPRAIDEPAPTLAGRGAAAWLPDQDAYVRAERVGHVSHAQGRSAPTRGAVRVTTEEAGVLQGFPANYPWQGTKTHQYQQVGNAIPPPLAWHVIHAAIGLPVDPWPHAPEPGSVPAPPVDYVGGTHEKAGRRPANEPAPTIFFGARLNTVTWQPTRGEAAMPDYTLTPVTGEQLAHALKAYRQRNPGDSRALDVVLSHTADQRAVMIVQPPSGERLLIDENGRSSLAPKIDDEKKLARRLYDMLDEEGENDRIRPRLRALTAAFAGMGPVTETQLEPLPKAPEEGDVVIVPAGTKHRAAIVLGVTNRGFTRVAHTTPSNPDRIYRKVLDSSELRVLPGMAVPVDRADPQVDVDTIMGEIADRIVVGEGTPDLAGIVEVGAEKTSEDGDGPTLAAAVNEIVERLEEAHERGELDEVEADDGLDALVDDPQAIRGPVHTCPGCGEPLKHGVDVCPSCRDAAEDALASQGRALQVPDLVELRPQLESIVDDGFGIAQLAPGTLAEREHGRLLRIIEQQTRTIELLVGKLA